MSTDRTVRRLYLALAGVAALGLGACWDSEPAPLAPSEPALAESSEDDDFAVGLLPVAEGLTAPVWMIPSPDGTGRMFVADQVGLVRVLVPDASAPGGLRLQPEPFLDIRDRLAPLNPFFDEKGLLGLAFHPDYKSNGRFYVYYSAPEKPAGVTCPATSNPTRDCHTSRVSEFMAIPASSGPVVANAASERVVMRIFEPQFNHNAGALAFGPDDGYLYIAVGDGGGANDVGFGHVDDWYPVNAGGNGQDIQQNLLGSILRIDVDSRAVDNAYGIPADNPFVGETGLDEIWAYGFRNPYRMSFDMEGSHDLFVADVGQGLFEEINVVRRRGNYGWNVKEGTSCFNAASSGNPLPSCPDRDPVTGERLQDPVIEYRNANRGGLGVAVVGGFVYRGELLPQFRGRYIFGDWSTGFLRPDGTLFVASRRGSGRYNLQELAVPKRPGERVGHYVLGFGQDDAGEMYLLTSDRSGPRENTGRVYMLVKPSGIIPPGQQ